MTRLDDARSAWPPFRRLARSWDQNTRRIVAENMKKNRLRRLGPSL
jgi:hypothetical protein